ncbi:MAG: hypothetical protein R3B13_18445 [Polyangiaceae bacterium]
MALGRDGWNRQRALAFAAGVFAVAYAGCGIRARVSEAAAPVLNCDPKEIQVGDVDRYEITRLKRSVAGAPRQAVAQGCGTHALMVESCPSGARSGSDACSWLPVRKLKYDAIVRRAAFDLSCEPGLLNVQYLDPVTVGVSGCTSQVTYIWTCPHDPDLYSAKCTWVMNNETLHRAAAPPAPAAPPAAPAAPPPSPPAETPPEPTPPPSDVNM